MIFLAAFVGWELRTERPVLDVRLFRLRGFSTGSVSIFLQFFAAFGFFYVGAQFLAFVFGYSPLTIGFAFLPVGVGIPLGAAIATRLSSTVSRGVIGGVGLVVLAAGAAGFTFLSAGSEYWMFALALLVFGAGMGLAGPPATEAIVEALPAERQGVASAINDVARELGGALGIALIGSMLTAGYRSGIDDAASGLPAGVDEVIREAPGVGLGVACPSRSRRSGHRRTPCSLPSPTGSDSPCGSPPAPRSSARSTSPCAHRPPAPRPPRSTHRRQRVERHEHEGEVGDCALDDGHTVPRADSDPAARPRDVRRAHPRRVVRAAPERCDHRVARPAHGLPVLDSARHRVWGALVVYNAVGAFDYSHGLATQWTDPIPAETASSTTVYFGIGVFMAFQIIGLALLFRSM